MNIKNTATSSAILILFLSFVSLSYAQENQTTNENFISQFMEKQVSNQMLNVIGIKEIVSTKELFITLLLILIVYALIFGLTNFTELTGKGTGAIISLILVLIGSQSGIPLKIAREMLTIRDSIQYLISNKWIILIIFASLVAITLASKLLKKTIKKTKEQEEKERTEERKSKVEKLAKIKEYETDIELKRYGVDN